MTCTKPLVGFATGNIYRLAQNANRAILLDFVKQLGVEAVELTFATKQDLEQTVIKANTVKWLRSLRYVSIHAPFRLMRNSKAEVVDQLDMINRLYMLINARNVIIHPNELPEQKILKRYNMRFSTENLPKKKHFTIQRLERILRHYQNLGMCLDVSHAYLWSKHETAELVRHFSKRITEVHISGTYRNKDHTSLRKVTKDFIDSIKPIRTLNVPFLFEGDVDTSSKKYFASELDYICRLLNKG
jgi:sugar phosphate isomerase/epimerase